MSRDVPEMAPLAAFAEAYRLPVRDPGQAWPEPHEPGPLKRLAYGARGACRRRRRGRRLAYLDSMFPWRRSGFRYDEARSLLALRPDTLFFSVWELTDPFPAPVHPLADFPELALREGVTDIYAVFSLFLEGLTGMRSELSGERHPIEGLDLSKWVARSGIRVHGTIFPGGGFTPTPDGLERARALASRLDTTFSYVPEVLDAVPDVTYVPQALTEVRFYEHTEERWGRTRPFTCLFVADANPRKGLDVALTAFRGLDPGRFHLHVVGPHEDHRDALPPDLATFHGWLSPERLRELHREVHAILSPVSAEPPGPPGSFRGVTDGFPTQAAADAMSSGALLVSANPASDRRVLTPGEHYVELPPEAEAFRAALLELELDPRQAREIAQRGSERVRERMDVRVGVARKLEAIGLEPEPAAVPGTATLRSE